MTCNKCGAQLPDGFAFCTTCGAKQDPIQQPPESIPAQKPGFRQPGASWQEMAQPQQPPQSFQKPPAAKVPPQPPTQQFGGPVSPPPAASPAPASVPPQAQAPSSPPPQYPSSQIQQTGNSLVPQSIPSKTPINATAGFAYIPFLFWIPLVAKKEDDVAKHAANQGLILTSFWVILYLAEKVVRDIFLTGLYARIAPEDFARVPKETFTAYEFFLLVDTIFLFLFGAAFLLLMVFGIIGLIKGIKNEKLKLPVFGDLELL